MQKFIFSIFILISFSLMNALPAQADGCTGITVYIKEPPNSPQVKSDPNQPLGSKGNPYPTFASAQKQMDKYPQWCYYQLVGPQTIRGPLSGGGGVPLPTPVLYSLLGLFFVCLFISGWLLQRRGQRLVPQL